MNGRINMLGRKAAKGVLFRRSRVAPCKVRPGTKPKLQRATMLTWCRGWDIANGLNLPASGKEICPSSRSEVCGGQGGVLDSTVGGNWGGKLEDADISLHGLVVVARVGNDGFNLDQLASCGPVL